MASAYEGVEPTFDELRAASLRKLRVAQEPQAQRISQAVRTAGVGTSGVGLLPGLEAERNRSASEAELETGLGQMRLGQLGQLEQTKLSGELQRQRDEYLANYGSNEERTAARERLQAALISGGIGAFSGVIGKRLGIV